MLKKLSLRNAQRQLRDYSLYFITLACAVSFMYAFNALIFSEHIKALSNLDLLPYLVIATSVLIVLILGWIVSYMTNYILKRRSKELSIYMLSGISNKAVSRLFFLENLIIGTIAFVLGLPVGILLSQLLSATMLHVFGLKYTLDFGLSISTAGLTFFYFAAMFLFSMKKSQKWIRKKRLYDLLYQDRQNELFPANRKNTIPAIFLLSVLLCGAGILLIAFQPLGNGYDILIGMILLMLFLFGFFLSVPTFLAVWIEKHSTWKYTKNHLITFRAFTSKIQSLSISMSILSILFMLAVTLFGTGIAANRIASRSIALNPFDIMILHNGEMQDFSIYNDAFLHNLSIQASHTYGIYTGIKKDFLAVREYALEAKGRPSAYSYTEYQYDTFMKQSDYSILREMLGYKAVTLDNTSYYIHCVPALEEDFRQFMLENQYYAFNQTMLKAGGISTEAFSQNDTYGNGLDYIVIVPDNLADQMKIQYSLYAAVTGSPISSFVFQDITKACEGLVLLNRSTARSSEDNTLTSLVYSDKDYVFGKWVQRETLSQLYSLLICMFYLALILEITGAAILATQIMSDKDKKERQDTILRQLGMNEKLIARLHNQQLLFLFLFPIFPALIISICLIIWSAGKIQLGSFHLPIFLNDLWIFQSIGIALLFFLLLYAIYYAAARISYDR